MVSMLDTAFSCRGLPRVDPQHWPTFLQSSAQDMLPEKVDWKLGFANWFEAWDDSFAVAASQFVTRALTMNG